MSQSYSSEQAEHSRQVLEETLTAIPGAILIGGWGSWMRTGGEMSHDIDLIVTRPELEMLGAIVEDLSESRHFGSPKWRASRRGVHLDTSHTSRAWARTYNCEWSSSSTTPRPATGSGYSRSPGTQQPSGRRSWTGPTHGRAARIATRSSDSSKHPAPAKRQQ